jgi:hypothetical protein
MGMYRVAGKQTTIAATKTALTLISATTCRPRLCDLRLTTTGAPTTDAQVNAKLQRFTAAGTSAASAPTPKPTDNGDPASLATAGWDHSAEPTYTDTLQDWFFNPRSVIQWAAYDPRGEILLPATAANGVGMQTVAAGGATGNLVCEFGFYDK